MERKGGERREDEGGEIEVGGEREDEGKIARWKL